MVNNTTEEYQRARELVLQFGWNTISYQILNPGILWWFSSTHRSVIGYVETSTYLIAAGAPNCADEDLEFSVLEFTAYAAAKKKKVCYFSAQERIAAILSKHLPASTVLLGAQPVWHPQQWINNVYAKPSLRAQLSRALNKGVTVELWESTKAVNHPQLVQSLHEWLAARHLPPMHFLVEPFTLERLEDRIVAAAVFENQAAGFCIASPIPLRSGWLIEQIVRGRRAPNGTAELLLEKLIVHLNTLSASLVTLGLSPLSEHYHSTIHHPLWLKTVLRAVKAYGKYFYNFNGLDSFKAKFLPQMWEPVYAITNEATPTPATLYAIATAFSGMSPFRFVMKGIRKMLF